MMAGSHSKHTVFSAVTGGHGAIGSFGRHSLYGGHAIMGSRNILDSELATGNYGAMTQCALRDYIPKRCCDFSSVTSTQAQKSGVLWGER